MKFIENNQTNPSYNLALENWILENLIDDSYLMLWRNDKSIIVGRNQNTLSEINQIFVEENNIKVVRRMTGGGAVYHDLSNINFSYFTDWDDSRDVDFEEFASVIIDFLASLGVIANFSGRNDLTINAKKIAGFSYRIWENRLLFNGAILFDTDLSILSKTLNVNYNKFTDKAVKSVSSRVCNIRPHLMVDMDTNEFLIMLKSYLFYRFDIEKTYSLDKKALKSVREMQKDIFDSWSRNYGQSIPSNYKNSRYFVNKGLLEVKIALDKGLIKDVKIYGDFFADFDIGEIEDRLIGQAFSPYYVKKALKDIEIEKYLGKITLEDLILTIFDS